MPDAPENVESVGEPAPSIARPGVEPVSNGVPAIQTPEAPARLEPSGSLFADEPVAAVNPASLNTPTEVADALEAEAAVSESASTAPSLSLEAANWADIVQLLPLNGMTRQFALNCAFESDQDGMVELLLATEKAHLHNNNFQQRLEEALSSYYRTTIRLKVTVSESISCETPSEVDSRRKAARLQQAQEAIANDANVRALIDGFDAQVQMSSIQPID